LFYGSSGTAKTTIAYILANHLIDMNPDMYVKVFNASDDRGIAFVRNEIKALVDTGGGTFIILDEADAITPEAQESMRILMDKGLKKGNMFVLLANKYRKIIPPIKSRTRKYHFPPNTNDTIITICKNVLDKEKIKYEGLDDYLYNIAKVSKGDAREALGIIQSSIDMGVLVVDPTIALTVNDNEAIIQLLEKVIADGDFLGLRSELQDILFRESSRMLTSDIIEIISDWSLDQYEAGKLEEYPFIQTRIALKKLERALTRVDNPVVQFIGFFCELRLIELQNR